MVFTWSPHLLWPPLTLHWTCTASSQPGPPGARRTRFQPPQPPATCHHTAALSQPCWLLSSCGRSPYISSSLRDPLGLAPLPPRSVWWVGRVQRKVQWAGSSSGRWGPGPCLTLFWLSMFSLAISGNWIDYYTKDEFIISSLMTHIFCFWHISLWYRTPLRADQHSQRTSSVFTVWNYWTQQYCKVCVWASSYAMHLFGFLLIWLCPIKAEDTCPDAAMPRFSSQTLPLQSYGCIGGSVGDGV